MFGWQKLAKNHIIVSAIIVCLAQLPTLITSPLNSFRTKAQRNNNSVKQHRKSFKNAIVPQDDVYARTSKHKLKQVHREKKKLCEHKKYIEEVCFCPAHWRVSRESCAVHMRAWERVGADCILGCWEMHAWMFCVRMTLLLWNLRSCVEPWVTSIWLRRREEDDGTNRTGKISWWAGDKQVEIQDIFSKC